MSISPDIKETGINEKNLKIKADSLSRLKEKNQPALFVFTYQSTVFRDLIIQRLVKLLEERDVHTEVLDLNTRLAEFPNLYNLVLEESERFDLLIIFNLGTNRKPDLHSLNLMRDEMRRKGIRLFFFLREEELGVFGSEAPDLWAFHQSFEIIRGKPTYQTIVQAISPYLETHQYKDSNEARERLLHIEDYLKETESRGDLARHRLRMLSEKGNIYHFLGEPGKAVQYVKEAMTVAVEIGDKKTISDLLNQLGKIHTEIGE